jgi:hypothetical protein
MRFLFLFLPALLAAGPARYARLGESQGTVEVQLHAVDPWIAAERNLPLPESAWLRTSAASRVEVELDEGSAVRAGANSQFEISDCVRLSTGQRITMIAVVHGLVYFTGAPEGRDALSVAVPGAQVSFTRAARIRLEVEDQWSSIAVLEGAVRFSSAAAELELREGQTTRVEPANSARFFFYREVLPNELDPWSTDRDKTRAASTSAAHVVQRYGLADLDHAGQWILTADMGAIWRPKVDDDWVPFQSGRWRWYDGLGYTWVASEDWGWLPYHYGRWTQLDNLGWAWVPARNGVFKPGEVYWLSGKKFVGWGPLGPGEQWSSTDPVNRLPQHFLDAYTTYAAIQPPGGVIDPAGFEDGPEDPLKEAEFASALPSPAFLASTLDAVRPLVVSARQRLNPVVEGTRVDTASVAPPRPQPAPVTPSVVILSPPAPPATQEVVEVPVPVAVPAGIVFLTTPQQQPGEEHKADHKPVTTTAAASPGRNLNARPAPHDPPHRPAPPLAPPKKFRSPAEAGLFNTVVRDLEQRNYPKSVADLDNWTERFRETEYLDERTYYYMLAYHGLGQPAKVLDFGSTLFQKDVSAAFTDPMQVLSAAFVAASDIQQLPRLTRGQSATAQAAGRVLLASLPVCFVPERKPREMSDADWARSRADLDALARDVLKRAAH